MEAASAFASTTYLPYTQFPLCVSTCRWKHRKGSGWRSVTRTRVRLCTCLGSGACSVSMRIRICESQVLFFSGVGLNHVCVCVNGLAGCNDNRFNVPLYFSKSRDYNVTGTAGKDDVVDSLCVADPFILEVLENTSAARRVLCRFCYASLRNELFPFRVSS